MLLPLLFSSLALVYSAAISSCAGGYKNGDKIIEENFVKKCIVNEDGWAIIITHCLTPKGTEVPKGTKLKEGKNIFDCIETKGGARVQVLPVPSSPSSPSKNEEPEEPKENLKCLEKYSNEQKYTEGSFVKVCSSTPYTWSITISACLTPSGKEISIGGKAEEGRLTYSCVKTSNGAKIETDVTVKGCENGQYQKGQTYLTSTKRFLLKCLDDYGSNDILACLTEDGKEVKVGEELTEGTYKHKCVKDSDGSVRYKREFVGASKSVQKGCGQYAEGQAIFSDNKKFKFICVGSGVIKFTACIADNGEEVKADTKKTIGDFSYECKSTTLGGATVKKVQIA